MRLKCSRANPTFAESPAIHISGTNWLVIKHLEHVLYRKSLSTFPGHALDIASLNRRRGRPPQSVIVGLGARERSTHAARKIGTPAQSDSLASVVLSHWQKKEFLSILAAATRSRRIAAMDESLDPRLLTDTF
jgi:hypothetical protein